VCPGRFRNAWLGQAPESFSHRPRRSGDALGRKHFVLSRRNLLTAIRGCGRGVGLKLKLKRSSLNHLCKHDLYLSIINIKRSYAIIFIHISIFVKIRVHGAG